VGRGCRPTKRSPLVSHGPLVDPAGERRWTVAHKPVPLRPPRELTLQQLEVQPPSRLSLREEDEASIFHVEYRLEPSEQGTRFTQMSEFEWKKLPRALHGTFARAVRREVRGQLRALKRHLER
jgi:Polyketide cyclase / dehydrase and lipid transport